MSGTDNTNPGAWFPDPGGLYELRWWDGAQWTEHVSSAGQTGVAPLPGSDVPVMREDPARIQRQVQQQARVATAGEQVGGGTIFTEPILVVNQKAKLIEINNEYAVFDQAGRQIGAVRQVGQSAAKKAIRVLTNLDQFLTHQFQVVDMSGNVLLGVTRPAKVLKSTVVIADPLGNELGRIRQENAIGKIRFAYEVVGQRVGGIQAENWRAWNFSLTDHNGQECARITKTWEGLAKAMFTTADNYVLQIHYPLADPLRVMVIASALCIDTALKQDSR